MEEGFPHEETSFLPTPPVRKETPRRRLVLAAVVVLAVCAALAGVVHVLGPQRIPGPLAKFYNIGGGDDDGCTLSNQTPPKCMDDDDASPPYTLSDDKIAP